MSSHFATGVDALMHSFMAVGVERPLPFRCGAESYLQSGMPCIDNGPAMLLASTV